MDKNAYSEAIFAGSACNLSGLAHSLSRRIPEIWKELEESGKNFSTTQVNQHPYVQCLVYQMCFLAFGKDPGFSCNGDEIGSAYSDALSACEKKSRE